MSVKLTTKEFIDRAITIHGIKYDYTNVTYIWKQYKCNH